jgi:hydroxymethylbilane synthase
MKFTIGSRGSQLALWQANWVKDQLQSAGHEVEIRIIKTTGDKLEQIPLTASGTKGLFIKEIEEALLDGSVDLAVHSMKDLPTETPAGLIVAAVPKREDARDVLISAAGKRLGELPRGARIGTSSLRRQSQLRLLRADIEIVPMRGNLDTRLRKLDRGDCEAVVLAAAGVHRLGWRARITEYFASNQICPAVGQGALAIECREDDKKTVGAVKALDDAAAHWAVRAERAMLRHLGGGCQVPIAAHAVAAGDQLALQGVVAALQGDAVIRAEAKGSTENPEDLGARVAEDLLRQGARTILDSVAI